MLQYISPNVRWKLIYLKIYRPYIFVTKLKTYTPSVLCFREMLAESVRIPLLIKSLWYCSPSYTSSMASMQFFVLLNLYCKAEWIPFPCVSLIKNDNIYDKII